MSAKFTITLVAAATVAVASLATSSSSYARGGFGGGGGFGRGGAMFARGGAGVGHIGVARMARVNVRTFTPLHPIWWHHHDHDHDHDHHHWVFRGGHWIIDDVAVEAPVVTPVVLPAASTPAPCTCLTKTYTDTGLVVFADVCTKESASAPATDDSADASQAPTSPVAATATPISQVPTAPNYAGRTYQDYLAANPQAAQPQVAAQPGQPTPNTP